MKILVFGRGVIGSQYGWALENAGHTVDFYVRKKKGTSMRRASMPQFMMVVSGITGSFTGTSV